MLAKEQLLCSTNILLHIIILSLAHPLDEYLSNFIEGNFLCS